jgi:hypothetical protein
MIDRPDTRGLYYIQNVGFTGNCLRWWKTGKCGYTCELDQAMMVTKAEADHICSSRPKEDIAWPVDLVDDAARLHVTQDALRGVRERMEKRAKRAGIK